MAVRRFQLRRDRDVTGLSGTGVVAQGVQFTHGVVIPFPDGLRLRLPPGWCRVTWAGPTASTVLWRSAADAVAVHGHDGATRLEWLDP